MANNAIKAFALSCRTIPIGAGLNQWYRPRAKFLKTPLDALDPQQMFQGFTFFLLQFFAAALSQSKHPRV